MHKQKMTATQAALVSMNVPHKRLIDEANFLSVFSGATPVAAWENHFEIFFADIPASHIQAVMRENALSLSELATVYEQLPKLFQGKHFKEMLDGTLGIAS